MIKKDILSKVIFKLLIGVNILLLTFIVWYWSSLKAHKFISVRPEDVTRAILQYLEAPKGSHINQSVQYIVIAFVSFCDDDVVQQLIKYAEIEEANQSNGINDIKVYFVYYSSDSKSFESCKIRVLCDKFVPHLKAMQIAKIAGILEHRSATFILDVRRQTLLTNYNYLLDATILQELIEDIT